MPTHPQLMAVYPALLNCERFFTLLPLPYLLRLSCHASGFVFFSSLPSHCNALLLLLCPVHLPGCLLSHVAKGWELGLGKWFRRTKKVVCELRRPYGFELDKMNEQET